LIQCRLWWSHQWFCLSPIPVLVDCIIMSKCRFLSKMRPIRITGHCQLTAEALAKSSGNCGAISRRGTTLKIELTISLDSAAIIQPIMPQQLVKERVLTSGSYSKVSSAVLKHKTYTYYQVKAEDYHSGQRRASTRLQCNRG
jgi:hypothetical protein